MKTQDELKRLTAIAALDHVVEGELLGVGTGSTANFFIDELAARGLRIAGAIASSEATAKRLRNHGIEVLELNDAVSAGRRIPVYVDGADEIDPALNLIKGGGGALTREKIVAAAAERFVCIADASKQVEVLGRFPLPVEVIPMARALVEREARALGGEPHLREGFVTDNGNLIVDIHGLRIDAPLALESRLNQLPGVVTNGIFALHRAHVALVARPDGVQTLLRDAV